MFIYNEKDFSGMSLEEIQTWVALYKESLIGSAVFTANNSFISRLVRWVQKFRCNDNHFIPSHVGSIVEYNNNLWVVNMQPPKASMTSLTHYISSDFETKGEVFSIIIRNFPIDKKMFCSNILEHVGEFYPYLSAVRSVFTKRESKWRRHCSELHLRELQKQGYYMEVNSEITPDELWHLLKDDLPSIKSRNN